KFIEAIFYIIPAHIADKSTEIATMRKPEFLLPSMITWRAFNQLFQHFIRICVLNTGKFVLFIILKFNTFYAGIILKTTCKLFSSRTVRNTPRTEMFNFINAIKGTRVIN